MGIAGFSPRFGPTPWCPIAIGRTSSRRKSPAVLVCLLLASSGLSPAAARPPHRLRLKVASHTTDRNLILDAFVFILASRSEIPLFERILPRLAISSVTMQYSPPERVLQATRNDRGAAAANVVRCRGPSSLASKSRPSPGHCRQGSSATLTAGKRPPICCPARNGYSLKRTRDTQPLCHPFGFRR